MGKSGRRVRGVGGRSGAVALCLLLATSLVAGLGAGVSPAGASFPGTNGKIFCQGLIDRSPGDAEVFSIDSDGSAMTLVTNNSLIDPGNATSFINDQNPAVSPNGKRVVFSTNRDTGSNVYIKNADGTGPEVRLTAEGAARVHGWSPDGKKVYFNNNIPGNNEVYVMNADGSNQVNLSNRGSSDVAPAGSPDGKTVLFHSDRNFTPGTGGDFDIYAMNPDGTNVRDLTNHPTGNDLDANWSPDGKQIVFERFASGSNSNIFKMNADGTGVTQLTFQAAGLNRNPVWSPDGTRIAFDSGRDSITGQPANQEVYTMSAVNGGDVRRVTNAIGADGFCDWQAIPRPAAAVPPAQRPSSPVRYPQPQPGAAFPGCPAGSVNVIRGAAGADLLRGTAAGDRIFAGPGNDTVQALGGDDCVDLGTGDDSGGGGAGADLMLGRSGDDRFSGGSGADRIAGGSGRDRTSGGSGGDTVGGGSGSDRLSGGSGADRITGGSGNDRLSGGSGGDRIGGSAGNDRIAARDSRRDRISCGRGRDVVTADRIDRVGRDCERVRRA